MSILSTKTSPILLTQLPISGETVRFRAITYGDQEQMATAMLSQSKIIILENNIDVLSKCLVDKDKEFVLGLSLVDIDHLYLNVFKESHGHRLLVDYTCKALVQVEDKPKLSLLPQPELDPDAPKKMRTVHCDKVTKLSLELNDIKLNEGYKTEYKLQIENDVIFLKIPTIGQYLDNLKKYLHGDQTVEGILMYSCFEKIYNNDSEAYIYPNEGFTNETLNEEFNSLPVTYRVVEKITEFIKAMPELELKLSVRCPHCGNKEDLHFKGMDSFFQL